MEKQTICVIGLGYIGLPTATLLANRGYQIHGADVVQSAVDAINQGKIYIVGTKAVLNAVEHRNYAEPSDTQIKIYDNKIVIASLGKLYGDMTLEKLKQKNYQSSLRNKLTAEAFYLTGNTEKYGSGFIRIENELKKYQNVSYEFKEIANAMQITFFKNEEVNILHKLIKKHPNKKTPFLAQELNTSVKNIERWIKQLKKEEKIEFLGAPKTGGYVVK